MSSSSSPRPSRAEPVTRLLALLKPYWPRFLVATITLFVGSGITLVYPQALRYVIDEGISEGSVELLDEVLAALSGLVVIQAAMAWIRHYLMSWLGERAVADLRRQAVERILKLHPSWFHERRTGELVGRLASDVTIVQGVVGTEVSLALRNAVLALGGTVLLFIENAALALLMVVVIPPLIITMVVIGRAIRRRSRRVQDSFAETSGRVQEAFAAITVVQGFVREEHEAERYGEGVDATFQDATRLARWRATFFAATTLVGFIGIGLIVRAGGYSLAAGEITPGSLTSFMLYTFFVATSLGNLTSLWGSLQRAAGATERLYAIVDTESQITDPISPRTLPDGGGAVCFENVWFRYPNRPDQSVLQAITLDVAAGETVALVGPSGAGKSTLTALVPRFYDPTEGIVRFDGVDLRDLRLAELRGAIAMVPQDPVLFSGSIRENIAYGSARSVTDSEIERAARGAHAWDFIQSFSRGLDTRVGERGHQLSGGQRQRIAIARALLRDPRVLILDEATSSLDAESEALVQAALERLMQNRTTLVIAHRLSTVHRVDRIVVLGEGRVVEVGSHAELTAQDGVYRRLVERQLIE